MPGGQLPGHGTCPTGTCQGVTCLLTSLRMVKVADLAPAAPPKPPVVKKQTLAPPIQPSDVEANPREFAIAREALQLDPRVQAQPYAREQLVALLSQDLTSRLNEKEVADVISPKGSASFVPRWQKCQEMLG